MDRTQLMIIIIIGCRFQSDSALTTRLWNSASGLLTGSRVQTRKNFSIAIPAAWRGASSPNNFSELKSLGQGQGSPSRKRNDPPLTHINLITPPRAIYHIKSFALPLLPISININEAQRKRLLLAEFNLFIYLELSL